MDGWCFGGGKSVHLFPWFSQPFALPALSPLVLLLSYPKETQHKEQHKNECGKQAKQAKQTREALREGGKSGAQCMSVHSLLILSFLLLTSHSHTSLVDTVDSRWRSNAEVELANEPIDMALFLLDSDEMEAWAEGEDAKISFE